MLATLMVSTVLLAQAKRPAPPAPPPLLARPAEDHSQFNSNIQHTIQKRREAAAKKKNARINRAIRERYEAEEARNFQERMAPLILQQQANQANQYYQYSTANALQNIGNAAAQNALSNRARVVGQYGPGYLPALEAPRVVTPNEVIQQQIGR